MRVRNHQSMVKIIKYVYATIILHNLVVRTPYQNDRITENGNTDSDSGHGCVETVSSIIYIVSCWLKDIKINIKISDHHFKLEAY
jgi:hypothetical protein